VSFSIWIVLRTSRKRENRAGNIRARPLGSCQIGHRWVWSRCYLHAHHSTRILRWEKIRREKKLRLIDKSHFNHPRLQCSRSCGKGIQKREVRCLNPDGQLPEPHQPHCREEDRPTSRKMCNDYPCKDDRRVSENSHARILQQVQDDPEMSNGKNMSTWAIQLYVRRIYFACIK